MKKKNLKSLIVSVLVVVLCAISTFFVACNPTDTLTDVERAERIIKNVSASILDVNDTVIQVYNSGSASPSRLNAHSTNVAVLGNNVKSASYTLGDRNLSENANRPIQQMTISFGYYALSEYFAEHMKSAFLNKTLYIQQTIYPKQEIYVKYVLNKNTFEIYIFTKWDGSFDEFINISIFYDAKTYMPTKYIHRENRHFNRGRNCFGHVEVDFITYNCTIATVSYQADSVDYTQATNEFLSQNLTRYIRQEFYFEYFKDRKTTEFTTDSGNIDYSYLRNFPYAHTEDGENVFEFAKAEDYPLGDEAMYYAFDRYLICEDENGALTKVYQ